MILELIADCAVASTTGKNWSIILLLTYTKLKQHWTGLSMNNHIGTFLIKHYYHRYYWLTYSIHKNWYCWTYMQGIISQSVFASFIVWQWYSVGLKYCTFEKPVKQLRSRRKSVDGNGGENAMVCKLNHNLQFVQLQSQANAKKTKNFYQLL